MKKINGPFGSKIDLEGNLVFPKITRDMLERRKKKAKLVIFEVEELIKKSNFNKARITELKKFKKDIEDLKLLEKLEKNKEHLDFLLTQDQDIKKYLRNYKGGESWKKQRGSGTNPKLSGQHF